MCRLHGVVFKPKWPEGFPTFTIKAWERVMRQEGFAAQARAGEDAIATIEGLLDKKPLCCRLSQEDLREVLTENPIAVDDICTVCGKMGMGAKVPLSGDRVIPHVCFACFVQAREHPENLR